MLWLWMKTDLRQTRNTGNGVSQLVRTDHEKSALHQAVDAADRSNDVDVVILANGLGGMLLGAILARPGFRLLAARYNVPEILNLANFGRLTRAVSNTHGVKRSFSYVWHREGYAQGACG